MPTYRARLHLFLQVRQRIYLTERSCQLFFCQELVQDALLVAVFEPVEYGGLLVVCSIVQLALKREQQRDLLRMRENKRLTRWRWVVLLLFRYERFCVFLLWGRKRCANNLFFRALSLDRSRIYGFYAGGERRDLCTYTYSFP